MPIWVTLYLALMMMSIPMGVSLLRQMERDWLHPLGGLLSALLSMAFVVAYWLPEVMPFTTNSTVLLFLFVVFWDAYSLLRMRRYLRHLAQETGMAMPGAGVWALGVVLMLPAYWFAAAVCERVISG